MAFKIAVSNQKGGTGKTTLSVNIAAAFEAGGNKVALVDADPQGTSVRWVTSGEASLPINVVSLAPAGKGIGAEIKKQEQNFDVVVIDCPGNLEDPRIASVLEVADFCLVPLSPSPADLYSTVAMIRVIEGIRTVRNPRLSSALMLNSVNGKTKMREEILKILKAEEIGEHLLDAQISQREVYRQTFALGTTIHHHNRYLKGLKEARAEIENLASEMAQYIASNRATGGANG